MSAVLNVKIPVNGYTLFKPTCGNPPRTTTPVKLSNSPLFPRKVIITGRSPKAPRTGNNLPIRDVPGLPISELDIRPYLLGHGARVAL